MKAILDTNLLLVLLAGFCDKRSLGRKKFVKDYGEDDFETLCKVLSGFEEFLVTPNVVTECSNLLCGRDGHGGNGPESRALAALFDSGLLKRIEEQYVESGVAVRRGEYSYLGVADCSLLALVDAEHVVVTADGALARAAQAINPFCINFNHVRGRSLLDPSSTRYRGGR